MNDKKSLHSGDSGNRIKYTSLADPVARSTWNSLGILLF